MFRVLRPGGRAAVVSTDWKSIIWHSSDAGRMEKILAAFAEHCVYADLPRTLGVKLKSAGFTSATKRSSRNIIETMTRVFLATT